MADYLTAIMKSPTKEVSSRIPVWRQNLRGQEKTSRRCKDVKPGPVIPQLLQVSLYRLIQSGGLGTLFIESGGEPSYLVLDKLKHRLFLSSYPFGCYVWQVGRSVSSEPVVRFA